MYINLYDALMEFINNYNINLKVMDKVLLVAIYKTYKYDKLFHMAASYVESDICQQKTSKYINVLPESGEIIIYNYPTYNLYIRNNINFVQIILNKFKRMFLERRKLNTEITNYIKNTNTEPNYSIYEKYTRMKNLYNTNNQSLPTVRPRLVGRQAYRSWL